MEAFVGPMGVRLRGTESSCCASLKRSSFIPRAERSTARLQFDEKQRPLSMGLFGLGFPELLVIGGAAALIFGPSKISEMGKSLGSVAGSVKKATNEFQDAMQESLEEADREMEERKAKEKETEQETKAVESEVKTSR